MITDKVINFTLLNSSIGIGKQMPKIYEYLGIIFFFYSNEHEPIHVHATYGNFESKAEFIIVDGDIIEIRMNQ